MKKFIVVSLIGFLILTLGPAGYGQEKTGPTLKEKTGPTLEFKASGYLDVETWYYRNVPEVPFESTANVYATQANPAFAGRLYPVAPGVVSTDAAGGAFDKNRSYWSGRGRLKFDAIMGENLKGTIWLEIDSTRWGEVAGSYASGGNPGKNNAGQWGADRTAIEVKNLNITFGVPVIPIPAQIQVGILPMFYRPGILAYTDAAGIEAKINPIDPVNIKLSYFKALEGRDWASDDVDVYGGDVSVRVAPPMTIGGYFLNFNMTTYPFFLSAPAAGPLVTFPEVNFSSKMWWLGLYADGKLGPVNVNLDFVYDTGNVKDRRDLVNRARDVDYQGWATMLRVDYPWEKFNIGLVGLYASGANSRETDPTGMPGTAPPGAAAGVTSSKVEAYVVPPQAEVGLGDLSIVFYGVSSTPLAPAPAYGGSSPTAMSRGQIGGTWAARLHGSYKATSWYKVTLQGLYIGDTTKNGNTIGTARKSPFGAGNLRDDNTIGWELDLINEIQIYKNLSLKVAGGVLFPGNAMDYFVNAANPSVSPKIPYVIMSKLFYSF